MYICRLFHRDRPFEQVEARFLAEGAITIGRDESADWTLADPEATLSRIHCVLAVEEGRLRLYDKSTNGTFLSAGSRAPNDAPVELAVRDTFRMGALSVLIDEAAEVRGDALGATLHAPLAAPVTPLPADWADQAPARRIRREASLLEAFCEGAKLDASALAAEDSEELMRRVGAIYQQTVLGLATLMSDRARMKREYDLERTTIGAADNNPFKWAPSRKLAQDLLCGCDAGFLSGPDAVRASFEDLGRHAAAVVQGADAAAKLAVQALAPDAIEAEAKAQASLLRGRSAVCWDIHARRHAALAAQDDPSDGALRRAFGDGYARALDASVG